MTINNCSELLTRIQSQVNSIRGQDLTWKQISNGAYHAIAIKTDGTLWTWGCNNQGRLGDGTTTLRYSPGTVAGGGIRWRQISGGFASTTAIKCDGTLWTWGCNIFGQLGDGTTVSRSSPGTIAGGGTDWCQVSSGKNHTAAIKTDGTLWTWGWNFFGNLGDGTTVDRCSPGTIAGGGTNWCQVSSGFDHTSAIKTDGTLWTWGFNGNGYLGDGTVVSRSSPGTVAGGGTNWCQVSGGTTHLAAIKTDGTLWTWGRNCFGLLGDGTVTSKSSPGTIAGAGTNWCQVSSGLAHVAAIKTDGTLWTWGCNSQGQLGDGTTVSRRSPGTIVGCGTNWTCTSSASRGSAAIKTDGTLWTWGDNEILGDGNTITRCSPGSIPIQLASSAKELTLLAAAVSQATNNRQVSVASSSELPDIKNNSISNGQMIFLEDRLIPVIANNECWLGLDGRVLRSDAPTRTLFTWGRNSFGGGLGDGTTVDRCSPGTVAGGGTTWCQLSFGNCHSAGLKTDGTLWTWGSGTNGRLGDGTTTERTSPGTVAGGGITWCQVSSGNYNTAAIKTDGTLWTWGSSSKGDLGNGTTLDRSSPGTVAGGGTNWCQVSVGCQHFAAIKTDGTLWTWGYNGYGNLGSGFGGAGTSRSSPGTVAGGGTTWFQVSLGRDHNVALKTDGTLWAWGSSRQGRLGNGSTINRSSPGTVAGGCTTWCQVLGGICHSAAVKTDGTLWTWGYNGYGNLGDGTTIDRCSPGTIAGGGTTWCQVFRGKDNNTAVKTDGTLWTWGYNGDGQLGNGTTLDRCSPGTVAGGGSAWITASNGSYHSAAITST